MALHPDLPKRIYFDALDYLEAAKLINSRVGSYGHSAILMSTLSFELLLKCIVLIDTGWLVPGHKYQDIWIEMSNARRNDLVEIAIIRQSGHADFSGLATILSDLQIAFTKVRYGYEIGKELGDDELYTRGRIWIDSGGKDTDADFRFRPWERDGLIFAMASQIQKELDLQEQDVLAS
ncbi:MAG: hypothetical protein AAGO57_07655 [Pseudomonadota bacterium]